MKLHKRLLCGPLAALILLMGIVALPLAIPGYSQIRQTVSEIGEIGSPVRIPFAALLCAVALALLVFASGLRALLKRCSHATAAAWLTVWMAVCAAGVGIFAHPHPLHNVFGTAELIGYQAPLALALTLRGDLRMKRLAGFSWLMTFLVWCAKPRGLRSAERAMDGDAPLLRPRPARAVCDMVRLVRGDSVLCVIGVRYSLTGPAFTFAS
ncbi:MAG TPA: DUF998 domain-containing protein [Rhizomicrobium sp.]|jgi:hypothetical membrane protein|nr:DUF998 domain-containing protein [Rhizomicrobium sp.]